jgi:peptide deformylase
MLPIITYPNPILETVAEDVVFPLDTETKTLIRGMWSTVSELGVGLAAPQVGVSKRICLVHLSKVEKGKSAKDLLLINPTIIFTSQIESEMVEGCLSFPDEYWKIWRPSNIHVEYFDEKGKKHTLKAGDWLARVILHEVDHLQGNIFIKKGGIKLDITDEDTASHDIID